MSETENTRLPTIEYYNKKPLYKRKVVGVFTLYGHCVAGGHPGHVTWNFLYTFWLPIHIKFCFDWPSGFREKK